MENENLARVGDAARLVEHQPGDRGGDIIGQAPTAFAVEVADRDSAVDDVAALGPGFDTGNLEVMLVLDLADDFLEDVLEGDDATQRAVFVDHEGKMLASAAKGVELGK